MANEELTCATMFTKCKKHLMFQHKLMKDFYKSNPASEKEFFILLNEVYLRHTLYSVIVLL